MVDSLISHPIFAFSKTEFKLALKQSKDLEASKVTSWKRPSVGVIKHKVDAAVQNNFTTLAAVGRNDIAKVIKGWAKY